MTLAQLWLQLLPPGLRQDFFDTCSSMQEWLVRNLHNHSSDMHLIPWSTVFGMATWLDWKQQNADIFSSEFEGYNYSVQAMLYVAREYHNMKLEVCMDP